MPASVHIECPSCKTFFWGNSKSEIAVKITAALIAGSFAFWMGATLFTASAIGVSVYFPICIGYMFKYMGDRAHEYQLFRQGLHKFIPDAETLKKQLIKFKEEPGIIQWLETAPQSINDTLSFIPKGVNNHIVEYARPAMELTPSELRKLYIVNDTTYYYCLNGKELLECCEKLDKIKTEWLLDLTPLFYQAISVARFSITRYREEMEIIQVPTIATLLSDGEHNHLSGTQEERSKVIQLVKKFVLNIDIPVASEATAFNGIVWLPDCAFDPERGYVKDSGDVGVGPRTRALQYMKAKHFWYESPSKYQSDIP